MTNFIKTFIQNRVDAVILSQLEKIDVQGLVNDAVSDAMSDLNIQSDMERMLQDAVDNLDVDEQLEGSIYSLRLDRMAEEKIEEKVDQEVETAMDSLKTIMEQKLQEGGLEHIINYAIGRQLKVN